MKRIKSPPKHHHFLSLPAFIISAGIILLAGRAIAQNAVLRSMFSCQAQGLSGVVPTITVSYVQGTNLSFLPAGETIKKVWINDISQVTIDSDGPLCTQFGPQRNFSSGDCKNSGANVIQLRRIPKLKIPGIPKTDKTLLTVITEAQGKSKLYTFQVLYTNSEPGYHTLAIYGDEATTNGTSPCLKYPR